MNLDKLPIRTEIEDGQPYWDQPIYARPAKELLSPIAESLADAFGNVVRVRDADNMPKRIRTDLPEILLRYECQRLRWMKRTKNGLRPR